jgi:hypothetical protein
MRRRDRAATHRVTGDSDRNLSRGKASPVPTSLANFGNKVARLCILDYAGDDEQQMDAGTVCHGEDEGAVKRSE